MSNYSDTDVGFFVERCADIDLYRPDAHSNETTVPWTNDPTKSINISRDDATAFKRDPSNRY